MSSGRRSERLSKQDPINYSDTKRISSPNRYSALDQEEEEEEESIVFYPEPTDDDWIITDTMSEDEKTKEIDLGLTKEELLPNNRATLLDILKFIRLLANKAANVGTQRTGLGMYADLVETATAYKERVGKEFTKISDSAAKQDVPSVVTAPTVSTNTNASPNDGMMAMVAGLVAALQQNQPTTNANRPTGAPNPRGHGQNRNNNRQMEWRQVNKWCRHCGANTSHGSIDCKSKGSEAPKHPDATKDKPEGGNTDKNKNWGLWYHPRRGYRDTKPNN